MALWNHVLILWIFTDFSRKLILTNFIFMLGVIQNIYMDLEKAR